MNKETIETIIANLAEKGYNIERKEIGAMILYIKLMLLYLSLLILINLHLTPIVKLLNTSMMNLIFSSLELKKTQVTLHLNLLM